MFSPRLLYGITVFLGAFLLFLIEPIAAKQLLPMLGGSSAVWLTCLVFFQLALLLGYLYAHWLTREPAGRHMRVLYLASLAAAVLVLAAPVRVLTTGSGSEHPVTTIFLALSLSIGLPFLLLSSTSPLLQTWFFRTEGGAVPYRLFALSNVASLVALIAYPIVVEPHLTLKVQRMFWSIGFFVYAVLCTLPARRLKATTPSESLIPAAPDEQTARASTSARILWFLLPMAAAMQLSAVTAHLTANIAAIPLLWMLPLAGYLLTFILAFEFPKLYRRGIVVRLLVVMLASLGYAISKSEISLPMAWLFCSSSPKPFLPDSSVTPRPSPCVRPVPAKRPSSTC